MQLMNLGLGTALQSIPQFPKMDTLRIARILNARCSPSCLRVFVAQVEGMRIVNGI